MATRSAPEPAICDLRCMLCGELTGQLVDAAFVHNPNCPLPVRVDAGRRRCCRCGGSLIKEASSGPQVLVVQQPPRPLPARKPPRR